VSVCNAVKFLVKFFSTFLTTPPYVIRQAIIFLPCDFCLLSSIFFPCLISAVGYWMSTICGLSVNLDPMSEMCCTRLAEIQDAKKSPFWYHRITLLTCIFAAKAYIDNRKNLLNNDSSSTRPRNMVNFGLLTAEISWRVWDTPANFNGFRVLAVLLHGTLVLGVNQTLRH